MNCPQCNAELPDSSAFCLQCGSSTQQTAFSYLPAGTPAWPTTVPQLSFPKTGTTTQAIDEIETHAPAKLAPKPRRSARSILAIVAILILTPLIGIGATLGILWANGQFPVNATQGSLHLQIRPTAGASSTPAVASNQLPTPTSFHTAKSSEVGVIVKYPADWVAEAPQQSTAGNVSINFHPQQQLPVDFSIGRLSSKNSASVTGTDVVNQANIQGFGTDQNLQNLQLLTNTPQHAKIGGVSWDEQDATFTDSTGNLIHVVSISVQHNKLYYNIFYFAPSALYDEAVQKYYSQMLASFQFQS